MTAQRPRTALDYAVAYSEAKHRDDPQPAEQRHTVDTINSDALDALYDDRYALATLRETHDRLWTEFGKERDRAAQAEAAIERVLAYAHQLRHKDAMGLLAALDEPKEPTK